MPASARLKSNVVAVMPSGPNTRVGIASSYAAPSSSFGYATCPPTKPAAAASGFEYWNISPNLLVGFIVASVLSAPSGVRPSYSNSHSIILTRQPGAGADQMLDEDAARDVGVAELERRQEAS